MGGVPLSRGEANGGARVGEGPLEDGVEGPRNGGPLLRGAAPRPLPPRVGVEVAIDAERSRVSS